MRDTHRIKEKYELSLDNRQIVSLTVSALVVLGGVFVLGVVVGKKLAVEQGAVEQAPADLLSAVDQKTAVLETVQKDASLTFQDELTKKEPTAPQVTPDQKVEPKPEEKPAPAPERKPETDAKAELAQKLAEASRPPTEPTKLPDTVRPEPVATRTTDAGALRDAFGKVQRTPEPPKDAAANGAWTLQLAAYQDRAEADQFAAGLRDKGYAPYIVTATLPNKGVWYRVRMGRFGTKEAATKYLADFKRETSMEAIVAQ